MRSYTAPRAVGAAETPRVFPIAPPGRNGGTPASRRSASRAEKPSRLRTATRPASDSDTPFIIGNDWEPVIQTPPATGFRSTSILIAGKISGAYWTSSIRTGGGKRWRNSAGSRRASARRLMSSSVT